MATTTGIFHSGVGIPLNSDGADGDHYRNTSNQDLWFKSGGTWEVVGNLRDDAPDGIGTTIQHGAGNPLNVNGEDGFYHRDTLNQNLWFKVEGIWHLLCRLGAPDQGDGGGAADCTLTVTQLTLPPDYTYEGTGTPYPIEPSVGDGKIIEIDIPYDDAFLYLPDTVSVDVSFILRFTTTEETVNYLTLSLNAIGSHHIKVPVTAFPTVNFKVFLSTLGGPRVEIIELGLPHTATVTASEAGTAFATPDERQDCYKFLAIDIPNTDLTDFSVIFDGVPYFQDSVYVHITGSSGSIANLVVGGAAAPHPVYPGDIMRLVGDPTGLGNFNQKLVVERTSYVSPPATMSLVTTASTEIIIAENSFTNPGGLMWNTSSGSAVIVSFPTPLSLGMTAGQSRSVNIRQGGTGVVTLTASGGASMEGETVFTTQYEVKTVMSKDDTTWIVVGAQ